MLVLISTFNTLNSVVILTLSGIRMLQVKKFFAECGFVRSTDLGLRKMLRDARTTASLKLRRSLVTQSQGRQWADSDRADSTYTSDGLQTFVSGVKSQPAKEGADLRHEYPTREQRKPAWRLCCSIRQCQLLFRLAPCPRYDRARRFYGAPQKGEAHLYRRGAIGAPQRGAETGFEHQKANCAAGWSKPTIVVGFRIRCADGLPPLSHSCNCR